MIRVGIISDTHGHVPAAVLAAFEGVDAILHAGDIGGDDVLVGLEAIAPVTAVRGNTVTSGSAAALPDRAILSLGGARILLRHAPFRKERSAASGFDVLVSGHTHRAAVTRVEGMLLVDPGSASRPRGGDAATVALLAIDSSQVTAEILDL